MENVIVPAIVLRSMVQFINPKDIRYHLRGVHIETGQFGCRLTATNGHILSRYNVDHVGRAVRSAIIPVAEVKAASKGGGQNGKVVIDISEKWMGAQGKENVTITLKNGPVMVTATPIDEKFPDVESIFPATISGESADFNPDYISAAAGFIKAANLTGHNRTSAVLHHNGEKPSVLRGLSPDAFVLLMPVRENLKDFSWPIQE
jgi:hypothetical protein